MAKQQTATNRTAFTPGPWMIGSVVTKSDGFRLFHLDTETEGPLGYFDPLDSPDENDEANARLIAAAPELYSACKSLLHRFGHLDTTLGKREAISQAQTALAKAEGRTN